MPSVDAGTISPAEATLHGRCGAVLSADNADGFPIHSTR